MSRFFESIRFQDGEFNLLEYHEERLNQTRKEKLGGNNPISLSGLIAQAPSESGVFKCKIVYGEKIEEITFSPYTLAIHQSVRLVEVSDFDYKYKAVDRHFIEKTVQTSFTDDVIFLKNGFLTDASYSNIALLDGNQWITPETYLLPGVKRRFLLESGRLKQTSVHISDLRSFSKIAFINAMRDFERVYSFKSEENDRLLLAEV
jgi:4-amino-4-deoxychorismate lyase